MSSLAYLIQAKSNISYLTGFKGSSGFIVKTAKSTYLITNALYFDEAKKTTPDEIKVINSVDLFADIKKILNKHRITDLYYEKDHILLKHYQKLRKELTGIKLRPQTNFVELQRITKTSEEIRLITKSLRIAEATMQLVTKKIATGVKEVELAWEIEKTARKLGAEDISFEPIVGFGKNTSVPHHQNGATKLRKGMPILIDMGVKCKGYCSDITRMFFTKNPTEKEEEIYNTVLRAQQQAEKEIKSGMTGQQADTIARNIIKAQGYGQNFTHSLGHGIGLDIHESPTVSPKSTDKLPENTIITIEPGIYIADFFGVRIEDMVLVERDKTRNLTRIPKKLENLLLKIT